MKLSVCPTPIGNLGDITLRVLETLKAADVIAAEDSRHTRKLLTHFEIKTKLIRYDDHHSEAGFDQVMQLLKEGKHVALVSDAGMPLVSDPGIRLIRACIAEGIELEVLPGATAFVNAWVLAGFAGDRFTFYGFLPRKQSDLHRQLALIKPRPEVAIFYEAPHRLLKTLIAMREILGNRPAVLARELTKLHEEVIRENLDQLIERLQEQPLKGEMVLLVEGASEEVATISLEQELSDLLALGMPKNEAVRIVAKNRNIPKREVYQVALDL